MNIPMYQVDAFTSTVFSGNPAAVCLLDTWLADTVRRRLQLRTTCQKPLFWFKTPPVLTSGGLPRPQKWPCAEINSEDIDFRAASEFFSAVSRKLTPAVRKTLGLVINHPGKEIPSLGAVLLFLLE